MAFRTWGWISLLLPLTLVAQAAPVGAPLMGFSREKSAVELKLEEQFDRSLQPEELRTWMKRLSARPHHLGSAYDRANAEFARDLFKSWGYQAEIEEFQVLFPTPKTRLLELTAPTKFTARLSEPVLPEDATSAQTVEQLPTYNAYSIDGDVTGELVYVNYGVPRDYEVLAEHGIEVKGKIVIARYGGSWRGIKPKVAAEHGAIGCIIYSDPHEDGYFQGDVYPKGGWRNDSGAQRGSVADMPLFPGDPLTPGIGATKDAKRLDRKDAPTLTKIPVLPLSFSDALPLLQALGGPVAPANWRGSLPLTYHLGGGPAKVHLQVAFDWRLVPLYDVIAKLPGTERPDQWIIRGNHHDAWVNGASDPISGAVALLEEARAVSALAKSGWKPKRTLVYALWDGEEPGLLGSTEWVETHAALLDKHAAVYINSDSNARGFLNVGGSHTLEKFINEVGRDVPDPERGMSVLERAKALAIVQGTAEERREARERSDLRIDALGSGSDWTPFLQHLGVASLSLGFSGEGAASGSYHSIYDSFDHYTRFEDPDFAYGIALARTGGRTVLRLANAEVLPFEFTDFSDTIARYLKELDQLTDDLRDQTKEQNRQLQDRSLEAVRDPKEPYFPPKPQPAVPYLNMAPLQNALSRLQESARSYDKAMATLVAQDKLTTPGGTLDNVLLRTERVMTHPQGLPRRPWFKHQIYAPGFYTGYGVKTLPAVREAIEERNWTEATAEIDRTAGVLNQLATEIDRATALLKS
ncbi:transferrin receptor-like dimerization domain-containing protein [Anthocerotibacter panamensis]|uniref:transferrin receptor-like dimerization domain-containing protein n=1 Tax=Anthocerotibacter panamensis TaxID=2857077 RepID=UPI001C4026D2|nr:transferrin receptor-like dimerization domain-containing protein [Anthocerotibacter panamensis]